jgi:Tol biopolymer transport system component
MSVPNEQITRHEFLKRTAAFAGLGAALAPLIVRAGEAAALRRSRISYYCNGEIHVNVPGEPESKPLTSGHWDFKPSWSKTGDMLVFFRRLKDDPDVTKWKTAISVINVDGTGLHHLSDGTFTDFNPTWTRDGKNTPVWNRKHPTTNRYMVMRSKVGGKPGQEIALTDERHHTRAHSCLMDGRLLVSAGHRTLGWGNFLLTLREGAEPIYQFIQCDLAEKRWLEHVSLSPDEKKVCFEFKVKSPGPRKLFIADFDAKKPAITSAKVFANEEGKPWWFAYPRWIGGGTAVVYHAGETGKSQLYAYRLEDGSTRRVSTNPTADYRYPHGEDAPC